MTTPPERTQASNPKVPKTPGVARPLIEWARTLRLSDSLILPQTPEEFVRDGVIGRMKLFGRWDVFWRIMHSTSTVGTVLLGVLASILAAVHAAHTLAIVAGALIAGLTTFNSTEKRHRQALGSFRLPRAVSL